MDTAAAPPPPTATGTAALLEEFGSSRLLLGDLRTAFLLLNAVRHGLIHRVFGVSREQENLLTAVIVLLLADSARRHAYHWLHEGPAPTFGDGLFAGGAVEELVCAIAGPVSRKTPMTGTLLTLALVAGAARPAGRKALHTTSAGWHRLSAGFHRQYGWLLDPGHRRQRRALRRGDQIDRNVRGLSQSRT